MRVLLQQAKISIRINFSINDLSNYTFHEQLFPIYLFQKNRFSYLNISSDKNYS